MKRTIGCVTVARSDYGIYTPVWDAIQSHPDLELKIFAAAAHLSPDFGMTVNQIRSDGYPVTEEVEMLLAGDSPRSVAMSSGLGTINFAQAFERHHLDVLVLLGDRFEMHAAAVAAVPFLIPIAHIHGGEETTGAIDNVYRHSITKLSHLHFASTQDHAQRIIQMGEEPRRVTVSGAPALDRILHRDPPPFPELRMKVDPALVPGYLLATFHPVTTEYEHARHQADDFLHALQEHGHPVLITMPNADTGGRAVREAISAVSKSWPELYAVENLGPDLYLTAMKNAFAMVGNSSSGIIEAASFGLPVVNVGNRQEGRARSGNTVDCPTVKSEILDALALATSESFLAKSQSAGNIYGDGQAAERIVTVLSKIEWSTDLIKKAFHSL